MNGSGEIRKKLMRILYLAGSKGVPIEILTEEIYKKDTRKNQGRLMRYVAFLRLKHGINIGYNKKNRRYFLIK